MKYINRFVVMDTETGGLPSALKKQATIEVALTEVAMVVVDNESLEIITKDSWLIKPYDESLIYDKGAEIASGISKKMCEKDGIDVEEVYNNIKKILVKNKLGKDKPIIIFHNMSFDIPFIENLFKLFNDDIYKWIDRFEDTIQWSRLKFVEKPGFKLGDVANYFSLDLVQAHRALPDTVVTAQIWIKLIKSLRNSESESSESKSGISISNFRKHFRF